VSTVLDVLNRAAADPGFASRFAHDPLDAAHSAGLQTDGRHDSYYLQARLAALARPVGDEVASQQLEEAAEEMRACLGLGPDEADREASRALFFLRDYRFHQRFLASAEPTELTALIDRLAGHGPPLQHGKTLLLTLHYGPFPLLWLWLKHAQSRGALPPVTLLYDASLYTPDLTEAQFGRLAAAGTVPSDRRDLDMAAIGIRSALHEAVSRLRSGEIVLMFPDAFAVSARERTLVCRVGTVEVAYPGGAAWLAEATEATVQGVVIRPKGDGHTIVWRMPRPGPATRAEVTDTFQGLLDASVTRDPAPWLAWFTDPLSH
jgi:hypothetical protein